MEKALIRMATPEDGPAIYRIYEPYILETAITFEYDPLPVEVFQKRIETVLEQYPWLVYEKEGEILGYAYCSKFKERAAFAWDCECSVYVDWKAHKQGIASALYEILFDLVREQGYYTVYALITNHHTSSIELHKKFGFIEAGLYEKTGYKLGQWWDLLVMEKRLRSFEGKPDQPKAIQELDLPFLIYGKEI
jgi:phosphinothricin acetyltransferase